MTHWQVETGTVGGQKQMTLLPDCDAEDLSAIIEDGREVWTISGRRARFKSTAIQLPAGWYRVRGVMDCLDGGIMSPGLRAEYADINYVGARYGLSEPGEDGTLGALIMLGADVVGLTFLPGVAPATFRMHSFTLQRVSRWHALRLMLGHDRSDLRRSDIETDDQILVFLGLAHPFLPVTLTVALRFLGGFASSRIRTANPFE